MTTTEQAIERLATAYTNLGGGWQRIETLAKAAGLTGSEVRLAIRELMKEDGFRAEPQPFNDRISEWDEANAPAIGGEARHLIEWA